MFRHPALVVPALMILTGCSGVPLKPSRPVPAGTIVLQFTRKIQGPLDLSVDGTRVPVAQTAKGGKVLRIEGLRPGSHKFLLSSPRDAFSPDHSEVTLPDDGGYYEVVFTQRFESVLYGKPAEMPTAEGLPGVKATLSPK